MKNQEGTRRRTATCFVRAQNWRQRCRNAAGERTTLRPFVELGWNRSDNGGRDCLLCLLQPTPAVSVADAGRPACAPMEYVKGILSCIASLSRGACLHRRGS